VFYREENKYHLLKDGVEYIVIAHHIKTNVYLVSIGKMKRLVSVRKYFVLMIVKQKEEDITYALHIYNNHLRFKLMQEDMPWEQS
jgi:tRNA splicing endonuclease